MNDSAQDAPEPEPAPLLEEGEAPPAIHEEHEGHDEAMAQEEPAAPTDSSSELGAAVLKVALSLIDLREDAGVNQDHAGLIRRFFLEGVPWPTKYWDRFIELHPNSPTLKPEWCAAFAAYCTRQAYKEAGREVPVKLSASAGALRDLFTEADRFVAHADLFDADGRVKQGARRPGPGDLVVWSCHVGLLKELRDDGTFLTIEGNTWRGSPRADGVYQLTRRSTELCKDGSLKLRGFCLTVSAP